MGIVVSTLTVGGSAKGSKNDGGTSNGIGLAMNNQYLYASFTDSNTIGAFSVQSGCSLTFLNDTAVAGLQRRHHQRHGGALQHADRHLYRWLHPVLRHFRRHSAIQRRRTVFDGDPGFPGRSYPTPSTLRVTGTMRFSATRSTFAERWKFRHFLRQVDQDHSLSVPRYKHQLRQRDAEPG